MRTERLILKNTVILGVGKALGDITTFLFLIYFSRSYGQGALGHYPPAILRPVAPLWLEGKPVRNPAFGSDPIPQI